MKEAPALQSAASQWTLYAVKRCRWKCSSAVSSAEAGWWVFNDFFCMEVSTSYAVSSWELQKVLDYGLTPSRGVFCFNAEEEKTYTVSGVFVSLIDGVSLSPPAGVCLCWSVPLAAWLVLRWPLRPRHCSHTDPAPQGQSRPRPGVGTQQVNDISARASTLFVSEPELLNGSCFNVGVNVLVLRFMVEWRTLCRNVATKWLMWWTAGWTWGECMLFSLI